MHGFSLVTKDVISEVVGYFVQVTQDEHERTT